MAVLHHNLLSWKTKLKGESGWGESVIQGRGKGQGQARGQGQGKWGGGVLTLQFEDWFRLGADPSVHSAVSVLLDCLLRSYSFSYVEKKS